MSHLSVYRFGPDAVFEGGLVGAIERIELGDRAAILDALFIRRDAATGDVDALDYATRARDGTFAALLDFRLDERRRRKLSEQTLANRPALEALADALEPGTALLAVLGVQSALLEEAVARCNGRRLVSEPTDARALAELAPRLTASVAGTA